MARPIEAEVSHAAFGKMSIERVLKVSYAARVFFFQAEDGIRDAQESRGLGDVYKRQDGINSVLRIRWPKSSDLGPKSDDSTHRIIKSKNDIAL